MESDEGSKEEVNKRKYTLLFMCNEENDTESCHKLGYFYEVLEKDFDKAKEVYENNCIKNSNRDSCHKMGSYMFMNRGGYKNLRSKALQILTSNCLERKSWQSCHAAGMAHISPTIEKSKNHFLDPQKALDLFMLGCEKGGANSCEHAGHLFYQGEKVPQDATKALKYFTIGCDLASIKSCNNAALMVRRGYKEVESNPVLFKEFRDKFNFLERNLNNSN